MILKRLIANLILTCVLVGGTAAVLVAVNNLARPQAQPLPPIGIQPPDYAEILRQVSPAELTEHFRSFEGFGSRMSGQEGCVKAENYIAEKLQALGYRVLRQPVTVTVPQTVTCTLTDESNQPIPGITIYPLAPNWFRTVTTPPDGLEGKFYVCKTGLARELVDVNVNKQFVLLPVGRLWNTVASMGAAAIFYYDSNEGGVAPDKWGNCDVSINLPRFAVAGDYTKLAGKTCKVKARVDYRQVVANNVIGIMEPNSPDCEQALVLDAYYDAHSSVPDLAVGGRTSTGAVVLLSAAKSLAGQASQLRRTVVLTFTAGHAQGMFGARELASAIGPREERAKTVPNLRSQKEQIDQELATAQAVLPVVKDDSYWAATGEQNERAYFANKDAGVQTELRKVIKRTLEEQLSVASEQTLQARIKWVRRRMPMKDANGDEDADFTANRAARQRELRVSSMLYSSPGDLKARLKNPNPRETLQERLGFLDALRQGAARIANDRVQSRSRQSRLLEPKIELATILSKYKQFVFIGLDMTWKGRAGMVVGDQPMAAFCMPADAEVAQQLLRSARSLDKIDPNALYVENTQGVERFTNLLRTGEDVRILPFGGSSVTLFYFDSSAYLGAGYPSFSLVTLDDPRGVVGGPADTFDEMLRPLPRPLDPKAASRPAASAAGTLKSMSRRKALPPEVLAGRTNAESEITPLENVTLMARIFTAAFSHLARGDGQFVPISRSSELYNLRGRIVNQLGDSLTPDHGVSGALVRFQGLMSWGSRITSPPGMADSMIVTADDDGRFVLSSVWPGALCRTLEASTSLDATAVDANTGQVTWALSSGQSGANGAFPMKDIPFTAFQRSQAVGVTFRCAGIQAIPPLDTQTLAPYASMDILETRTMSSPQKFLLQTSTIDNSKGIYLAYVPPDTRVCLIFKSGSLKQPNVQEIRGLALGLTQPSLRPPDRSAMTSVPGYFVADCPSVPNIELDMAESLTWINSGRVALQQQYNMADEALVRAEQKAQDLSQDAEKLAAEGKIVAARKEAIDSIAFGVSVHPIVRQNATDAIYGIMFYLALALPFAIFMEKLLIGHPDIRYQLLFQGIIFGLFFLALRVFHPAYKLVNSSFMILLGFITFVLSAGVATFVAGRFSSSIKEIHRKMQQRVETADVSRMGAASAAFVLGLNNLRKRPLRTGLTILTLVLMTFVMLCFTGVRNDIRDVEFPVAKAAYTGLLHRGRNLETVASAVATLDEEFGRDCIISARVWGGNFAAGAVEPAKLLIRPRSGSVLLESSAQAALGLSVQEPNVTPIRDCFEVLNRWFNAPNEKACFLPRQLADMLEITDDAVRSGTASVNLAGTDVAVLGIFNEHKLETMLDLDGQSLLPVDIMAMTGKMQPGGKAVNEEDNLTQPENLPRMPASSIVITPTSSTPSLSKYVSVAVAMPGVDYSTARARIQSWMDRSGRPLYYGLDGVAYYGGKFRLQTLAATLDLLLPIILSALAVLNTMRASVYERKNELYVFNAVGLAPNHIITLFLAEATVYAVVGAVGGYLLAQAVGWAVNAMHIATGLNLNYASLSGVFISLILMAVVFLSSIFPARMASRLAAPAETMTRQRQTSSGDVIELDLPFIFNRRDRVAVVPYFIDWFDMYGEASAGDFFAAPPEALLMPQADGQLGTGVQTVVWLKPYDLGVSQDLVLAVKRNATGDHVATVSMTRKSGDRESWERCCHRFIGLLRKRCLTWRAISDADRQNLFDRGGEMLRKSAEQEPS